MNVYCTVSRDSVARTATRYDLDGPGIEIRWGGDEINRTFTDRP
jgi:hypothetical protein